MQIIFFFIESRVPKAYSTCKMESHCRATMEVVEEEESHVVYYKTHFGHEKELKHLFIDSHRQRKIV